MRIEERSYETITIEDLEELQDLALRERIRFFERNQHLKKAYLDSLIAITLCQGAALHLIDGKTGINDFDIWYFYVKNDQRKYPYRARKSVDSKFDKFGVHPADLIRGYKGRRVDLMGRTIDLDVVTHNKSDPKGCLVEYLKRQGTKTAQELAKKAVIGLWPQAILGKVIWPFEL